MVNMSRNVAARGGYIHPSEGDKARCRGHGRIIEVPIDPVLQEHERLLGDINDPSIRKLGKNVMAEKVAGSGIFYRAFVKGSKPDRVLLYFPADANDPCVLEWVYKTSSRIYRNCSGSKWKYQGNGAWILVEKSKKAKKSVKRSKSANGQLPGCDDGAQAAGSPDSDRCQLDEHAAKPSECSSSYGDHTGTCVRSPWEPSPISRWFQRHLSMRERPVALTPTLSLYPVRRSESTPPDNRTPDTSIGEEFCNSSHEDVILSGESADARMQDCHVRHSCTGGADEPQGNESPCELRFREGHEEDDGSNSEPAHEQSPSSSGCMAQGNGLSCAVQHTLPVARIEGLDDMMHLNSPRNDCLQDGICRPGSDSHGGGHQLLDVGPQTELPRDRDVNAFQFQGGSGQPAK